MTTNTSTYYTPTRLLLARLHAAIARLSEMVQELVKVSLEEKLSDSWDENDKLWSDWISDNYAFVKKCLFFKDLSKRAIAGVEVPIFSECDVTFLGNLLPKITTDLEGIAAVKKIRNNAAHSARTEVEEDEYDDEFFTIETAVDKLFENHPILRRKWRRLLLNIRQDDIENLRHHVDEFARQMHMLNIQEQTIRNFNQNAQNQTNFNQSPITINMNFGDIGDDSKLNPDDLAKSIQRKLLIAVPPLEKINAASKLDAEELADKLLITLAECDSATCPTLTLAKKVGLETKHDINPTLKELQSQGMTAKISDVPPAWVLTTAGANYVQSLGKGKRGKKTGKDRKKTAQSSTDKPARDPHPS